MINEPWIQRSTAELATVPLRWRTWTGRATAARNLELLAMVMRRKGWRCLRLYYSPAGPLLWVCIGAAPREVGAVVTVRATRGGAWGYFRSPDGHRRPEWLAPCGDALAAADRLDTHLHHKLYPGTFPEGTSERSSR